MHTGFVGDFQVIRRDLMWAIDPKLFAGIVGSTDTEVVFRLALTFGLEEDPIRALERTVGLIEATATERGVAPMVQGTFGVSDGSSLWAVRYATEGRARSLFASADVESLHRLYPDKKMWFATATSERPADRVRAVLGPAGRVARDRRVVRRDRAQRRRARTRAVPPSGSAGHPLVAIDEAVVATGLCAPDGTGNSAVTTVPSPGGLETKSRPSSAATRSDSPRSPEPALSSAPPTPSSAISITATSPLRATLTDAFVAWAYFATLVSASEATK